MAKSTAATIAQTPDAVDAVLVELAAIVLSQFFFDPDREARYKSLLNNSKHAGRDRMTLEHYAMDLSDGECTVRLDALKTWTRFRVSLTTVDIDAAVEGTWSFEREELRPAEIVRRTGDAAKITIAATELMDNLTDPERDDEQTANIEAMLEDDEASPDIGDNPREPPPPTSLERSRAKAIAKRVARMKTPQLGVEDYEWLQSLPQMLPVITENLAAACVAATRDEAVIVAYRQMLTLQLEAVRYRLDRGWTWAVRMLNDYQQRLIALAEAATLSTEDWLAMATALSNARVPVSEDVQMKLAEAGVGSEDVPPEEEMLPALRSHLSDLSNMVESPFEVMEALEQTSVMMPTEMRSFLATELSLSPHLVLRDAVPLILLDADASVRRDAAGALAQNAGPAALSPEALRRTIAMRNWLPASDRAPIDSLVRAARLAGVETAAWPRPAPGLEFYASHMDGSGAQSIVVVSRSGKKGFFTGLLLRQGVGIIDAWVDADMPRAKVARLLRDTLLTSLFTRVEHSFVDLAIQHAICCGVARETPPPPDLLRAAELVGGAGWQDRGLDVVAEIERRFQELSDLERQESEHEALRRLERMTIEDDAILGSWLEDGPAVREALAVVPRAEMAEKADQILRLVLLPNRMEWAERFLLTAIWSAASQEAKYRKRYAEFICAAQGLIGNEALETIPAMVMVAARTVQAAQDGGW